MRNKFTIKELQLAEERSYPSDVIELIKKHFGDEWEIHWISYIHWHRGSLLSWIFSFKPADLERCGEKIDGIISDLLKDA